MGVDRDGHPVWYDNFNYDFKGRRMQSNLVSGSEASQTALSRRWVPGAEKPRRTYHEQEQSHLPRKHTQP